jgi:predicted nucleic acid-binding protein
MCDDTVLRPSVFLDTNVIIDGQKRRSVETIRGLAQMGLISLYISPDTLAEQEGRSLGRLRQRRYEAILAVRAAIPGSREAREAWSQEQSVEEEWRQVAACEKEEMAYWSDVPLQLAICPFSALVSLAALTPPGELLCLDKRGEMREFEELMLKHGIRRVDAILLEIAHSQECDYFISSDERKFLQRARRVVWLKPRLVTPAQFLREDRIAELTRRRAGLLHRTPHRKRRTPRRAQQE